MEATLCASIALDIGGSLVKVVLWERGESPKAPEWLRSVASPCSWPLRPVFPQQSRRDPLLVKSDNFPGVLRCFQFPVERIPDFVQYVKENGLVERYLPDSRRVLCTGGGAIKYADLAKTELDVTIVPHVCPNPIFPPGRATDRVSFRAK